MFDINEIISAAFTQATTLAIKPLLERIEALEINIAMLQNSIDQKDARIAALENNPAQGVDTSVVAGNYAPISNEQIKAALQEWATTGGFVTHDKVDALIEQAMDNHLECYDHDNYDAIVSKVDDMPDPDDIPTHEGVRDAVDDVLSGATLSIRL